MISRGTLHCPSRFDSCKECVGKEVREEYVLLVDRRGKIIETSEDCGMTSPPGKTDARFERQCTKLCFRSGSLLDSTIFNSARIIHLLLRYILSNEYCVLDDVVNIKLKSQQEKYINTLNFYTFMFEN